MKALAIRLWSAARRFWHYLLLGSDELVMPKSWLKDRDRLRHYTGYTRRQLQQGAVVTTADQMKRRADNERAASERLAFWEAVEAKQLAAAKPMATVTHLRKVK